MKIRELQSKGAASLNSLSRWQIRKHFQHKAAFASSQDQLPQVKSLEPCRLERGPLERYAPNWTAYFEYREQESGIQTDGASYPMAGMPYQEIGTSWFEAQLVAMEGSTRRLRRAVELLESEMQQHSLCDEDRAAWLLSSILQERRARGVDAFVSLIDSWTMTVESGAAELQAALSCRFGPTFHVDSDIKNLQHLFGGLVVPGTRRPLPSTEWHFEHDDLVSVTCTTLAETCACGKILSQIPSFLPRTSTYIAKGSEGKVRRICGWNCRPDYVLVEFGYEKCAWLRVEDVKLLAKCCWPDE